jgi:hypothetical protein
MFRATRIGAIALLVALGSPFHTKAQPSPPTDTRIVPMLGVYAMPGFKTRAPGLGAGGVMALDGDPESAQFASATLQADAHGLCSHSLQMPAGDLAAFDEAASAAWRIEASPVSVQGEEATVEVRWKRRVPRPGRLLEDSLERVQRLTLRDGARGILDVVHSAGDVPGVCDSFGIAVELRFGSRADVFQAGLGFDLWLIDRSATSAIAPLRVRTQARSGEDASYGFPPLKAAESGNDKIWVNGVVSGRARNDGTIDLIFDTTQSISDDRGFRSADGRKRLVVRAGETIEFELSEPLRAKLPPELQRRDLALRVTTERLW